MYKDQSGELLCGFWAKDISSDSALFELLRFSLFLVSCEEYIPYRAWNIREP